MTGKKCPQVTFFKQEDAFGTEPPVEQERARLCDRKQHDAIELQERREPPGGAERMAAKYACRMISPTKVIAKVEKMKAATPVSRELESSVSSTLVATLPHRIVARVRLESFRNSRAATACGLPPVASSSSRSLLTLKTPIGSR